MDWLKYSSLIGLTVSSSWIITYVYINLYSNSTIASLFFIMPAIIGFWLNKNEGMYDSTLAHVLHMSKDILIGYVLSAITTLVVVMLS